MAFIVVPVLAEEIDCAEAELEESEPEPPEDAATVEPQEPMTMDSSPDLLLSNPTTHPDSPLPDLTRGRDLSLIHI